MAKVLSIDAAMAGMSGDMLLSGLLGLIETRDTLLEQYLLLFNDNCGSKITAKIMSKEYQGFQGYYIDIKGTHGILTVVDLREKLDHLLTNTVNEFYREIGINIIQLIISTENLIHNDDNVTLHELGTYDTLIDIGLTVYLLEFLNISKVNLSALATGTGIVNTDRKSVV